MSTDDDGGEGDVGAGRGARSRTVQERVTADAGRPAGDRLLTPFEVAELFRVDAKTVTRWANSGRLASVRTPGGQRRFWRSEIRALLEPEEKP